MNEESSTTNMELPIACVSVYVIHAVIQFLTAKNTSEVEIHRQLTEVYDGYVMSVQMMKKWCLEFCEGRHEGHDELCTGRLKVVIDKSVNTICMLLNKDRCFTRAGNDNE